MTDATNRIDVPAEEPTVTEAYMTTAPVSELRFRQLEAGHERLAQDFMRLVLAVEALNKYSSRIAFVQETCEAILAPDPATAKANESIGELRAARANLGPVTTVVIDWDDKLRFLTTIRGRDGYCGMLDGFSLIPGSPGLKALQEACNILGLAPAKCDFTWRSASPGQQVARHVVYQAS